MTREEYMKRLQHRLRRLPKEDYEKAVTYFAEYFEEAGSENEAQAIEDLGEPEQAADQKIRDIAVEYAKDPVKVVKRSFSAVWIVILAVFAAPIGLPLVLACGVVVLALGLAAAAIVLCIFVTALSVAVSSVPCIVISVFLLFTSFADGIATLGMGLLFLGAGILLVMGSYVFNKWFLHAITRLFGRIAKGGKCHEK